MASSKIKARNKVSTTYTNSIRMTVHEVGEITIVEFTNSGSMQIANKTNYTPYNIAAGYGRPLENVTIPIVFAYNGTLYSTGTASINTNGNVYIYVDVPSEPSGEFTITNVSGIAVYMNS